MPTRIVATETHDELWTHHIWMTRIMGLLGVECPREAAASVEKLQELARAVCCVEG